MKLPDLEPEDLSHDFLEAFAARLNDSSGGQMTIACGAARRGCVIIVLDVVGPWQPQASLVAASGAEPQSVAGAAGPNGIGAPAAQVLPPPLAALLSALPVNRQPGMRVVFRQPAATTERAAAAAGATANLEDLQHEAGVVVEWVGPEQGWRVVPNAAVPALPAGAYGPGYVAAAAVEGGHGIPLEGSLSLRPGPLSLQEPPAATTHSGMLGAARAPQQRPLPQQLDLGYRLSQQHLHLHHQQQQTHQPASRRAQLPASAAAVTAGEGLPDGGHISAGAAGAGAAPALPSPPPPRSTEGRAARNSPPAHILCSLRGLHGAAAVIRSKGSEGDLASAGQLLYSAAGSGDTITPSLAGQFQGLHSGAAAARQQMSAQHRARSFGGSSAAPALPSGGFGSGPQLRRDCTANSGSSGGGGGVSVNSGGSNVTSGGGAHPQSLQVHKHSRAVPLPAAGSADSGSGGAAADAATAAAVVAAATAGSVFRRRARSASVPYGHPNGVRALLETHHEHSEEQPSPPPRRKRADAPAGPQSGPAAGPAASGQALASADAGGLGARGSPAGAGAGAVASHGGACSSSYGDECDIRTSDIAARDVTRAQTPTAAQALEAGAPAAPASGGLALGARPAAQGGCIDWGRTMSSGVGLRWSGAAAAMEADGGPPGQGGALAAAVASATATAPAAGRDAARAAYARTGSFMRPGALAAAPTPDAASMLPASTRYAGTFSSGLHPGYLQAQSSQSLQPPAASRLPQAYYQPGSSVGSRMEWGAGNTEMDLLWSSPRPWAVPASGATAASGPRRGPLAQPGAGAGGSTGPGGHRATPYVSSSSAAAAAMATATALVAGHGAQQHQQQRQRSAARHLPVSAAPGPAAAAAHQLSSTSLLSNVQPQALDTGFTEACAWLMQTQRQTPPQLAPPPASLQTQLVLKDQNVQHSLRQQQSPQHQRPRPPQHPQQQRQQARALQPDQALREAQRMRLLWRGGSGDVPARAPSGASAASDDADLLVLDEALASLLAEYQHPNTDTAVPDALTGTDATVVATAGVASGAPQPAAGVGEAPAAATAQGEAVGSSETAAAAGGHGSRPPVRHTRPQLRLQEASEDEPELEALLLGGSQGPSGTTVAAAAAAAAAAEGAYARHTVHAGGSGIGHSRGPAIAPDYNASVSASASARNVSGNWADGASIMSAAAAAANAAVAGAATVSSGINSSTTGGPTSSAVAVAPLGFAAAAAAAVTASQSSGGPGTGAGAVVDTSMSIAAAVGASGLMSLSQPAAPFLKVRHPPGAAAAAGTESVSSTASPAALAIGGAGAGAEGTAVEAAPPAAAQPPAVNEVAAKFAGAVAAGSATAQRHWSPSSNVMHARARSNSPEQRGHAGAAAGSGAEPATGPARLGSGSGRRPGVEPPGAQFQGQLQTYGTTAAYCDSFWATTIPEATGEGSLESSGGQQAPERAAAGAADAAGAKPLPAAAATAMASAAEARRAASVSGLGAPVAPAEAPPGAERTSYGKAVRVGGGGSVLRALSSGLTDDEDEDGLAILVGDNREGASEGEEEDVERTAEAAELVALLTRVSSGTIRRVAVQALEGSWLGGSEAEEEVEGEEGADGYLVIGDGELSGALVGRSSSRDDRSGGRLGAGRSGRSWCGRGPAPPSGHVTSAEGTWGTSAGGGLLAQPANRGVEPASLFAALPDAVAPLQPTTAGPRPAQALQPQQLPHQPAPQVEVLQASPGTNREAAQGTSSSHQLARSAAAYGAAAATDSAAVAHAVAAATGLDSVMIFTDADPWAHSPWDGSAAAAAAAGAAGGPGGEAAVAAAIAAMGPPTLEPAALVPPPTPMACVSFTVCGLPPAWAATPPPTSTGDLGGGGGAGGAVAATSWRRNSVMSTMSNTVGGGGGGNAAAAANTTGGAGGSYWGMMTTFVSPPGEEAAAAAAAAVAAAGASPSPGAAAGGGRNSGGGTDGSDGLLVAVRCAGRYLPVQWSWRQQRGGAAADAAGSAGTGAGRAPVLELSVSGLMGQGLLVVEVWYGGVYYASLPAVVTYDPRLVDDLLGRPPPPRPQTAAAGSGNSRNARHRHSEHPHGDRGGGGGGGGRARHRRSSAVAAGGAEQAVGGAAATAARGPVPDDVMYDLGIWLQYVASTAPLSRREALAEAAAAAVGFRGGARAGAAAAAGYAAAPADASAQVAVPTAVGHGVDQQHPRHQAPPGATAAPAEATRLNGYSQAADRAHASPSAATSPARAPRRRALMDTAAIFNLGATQTTIHVRGGGGGDAAGATDARGAGSSSAGGGVTASTAASGPDGAAGPGFDTSLLHVPIHLHAHMQHMQQLHDQVDDADALQALQPSDVLRYTTAPTGAGGLEPWLPRSGDTLGSSQIFSSSSVAAFAAAGARAFVPVMPPAPVTGLPTGVPVDAAAVDVGSPRQDPVVPAAANTVVASATNVAMSVPADFEAAVAAATSSAAAGSTLRSDGAGFSVGSGTRTAAAATAAAALAAMAEPLAAMVPPGGTSGYSAGASAAGGAADGGAVGGTTATTATTATAAAGAGVLEAANTTTSSTLLLEDTAPPSRRRICHDSAVDMTVPILPGSVDMSAAVAALQRGPAYGQQMQELAVGLLAWLVFAGRPVAAAVVLRGLMGHRALRFTEVCDQVRSLGAHSGVAARGAGAGAGAAAAVPGLGMGMGAAADGDGLTATGYGGMGLLHLAVHSGRREMIEAVVGWSAALSPVSEAAAGAGTRRAAGLPPAAAAADRFGALRSDATPGGGGDRGAALPASEWCELCAAGVGPLHLAAALVMPAATVAVAVAVAAADDPARDAAAEAEPAAAGSGPEGVDMSGLDTLVWLLGSFPETRALWGSARDAYGTTPGAILSYYLRSLPPASADAVRAALMPLVGPEHAWAPPPTPPPQWLLPASAAGFGLEPSSQQTLPMPGAAAQLQPPNWARHLFEDLQQYYSGGAASAPAAATAVATWAAGDGEPNAQGPADVLAVARAVAGEAAELEAVPPALRLVRIARLLAALAAAALLRPRSPPASAAAAAATAAGAGTGTATAAQAPVAAPAPAADAADARAEAIRVALAAELQALLRGLVLQAAADPAPVMLLAMALLALLVVRVWDALSPPERR